VIGLALSHVLMHFDRSARFDWIQLKSAPRVTIDGVLLSNMSLLVFIDCVVLCSKGHSHLLVCRRDNATPHYSRVCTNASSGW
jgi:hypothetical protein